MARIHWHDVEFSTVEENPESEVREGAEATGVTFEGLNLTVEALGFDVPSYGGRRF